MKKIFEIGVLVQLAIALFASIYGANEAATHCLLLAILFAILRGQE